MTTLLAVPNFSEGRDAQLIETIAKSFDSRRLDLHSDPDHHRSVLTIAGPPGELAPAVLAGARAALQRLDLSEHRGAHPRIGVLDVAPIVYLQDEDRGAACAEALVLGDLLGSELDLPVFLYGALGGGRTRAELRRGGPELLAERIARGELHPDFGPPNLHPRAGAVLVGARAPLIAFNLELGPTATLADAKAIAADIREGGASGFPAVRALGIWLERRQLAQVSINIEDHRAVSLDALVHAIGDRTQVAAAELVGLAPRTAFEGWPEEIPIRNRATIEDALQGSD